MKGNSNIQPSRLERIGSQYQVRWNIERKDRTNEDKQQTESWDFEYVNAVGCTRDDIIRAVIRDRYPRIDDEIAVINNKETKPSEYAHYQECRTFAKQIADETV